MKTLVVYYSLEGNTKHTAKLIAEITGADIIELCPVEAYPTGNFSKFFWGGKGAVFKDKPKLQDYDINISDYNTVIVATPLWAGTITPPVRTFLCENDFSNVNMAAVVCCGGGKSDKAFEQIKIESGKTELTAELTVVNALKDASIKDKLTDFCEKTVE